MQRENKYSVTGLAISVLCTASWFILSMHTLSFSEGIPSHPSSIKYKEFDWEIPLGREYKDTIDNRILLYTAADRSLPLVEITGYINYGTLMDPEDKRGLVSLYANLLRNGGTESIPPDSLDIILERYSIDISFSAGINQIKLRASFLSEYTDTALKVIRQILLTPAFSDKRFIKERDIMIQHIKHRFEEPSGILSAGYTRYMYPNTLYSRLSTEKSINNIDTKDLKRLHSKVLRTSFPVFAVSGRIETKDIHEFFEHEIAEKLPAKSRTTEYPDTDLREGKPVNVLIHKDITQAYIRMGLPGLKRPHKDYYPLSILNHILGGGGFTSRLASTIRVKHGLAYSVYSRSGSNYTIPATISITLTTKTSAVNKAVFLTVQEIRKILEKGVTEREIMDAKTTLIDELPSFFRDKGDIVDTYAWNSLRNREENHYKVYPEKIRSITRDQIIDAAEKYLQPDRISIIVTGDSTGVQEADPFKDFSIQFTERITPEEILK